MSIKKIVRTLCRIHTVTVTVDIDGHDPTARTPLDDDDQAIISAISTGHQGGRTHVGRLWNDPEVR
nr:hypothetical protein [Dietzia psychralcaliphila]